MPTFKTNQDIFKTMGEELFDENQWNYPWLVLPETRNWDSDKEPQVEDVNIWEVLFEAGGGTALYAAWDPYAKFFMFRHQFQIETYYGNDGEKRLEKKLKELNISYPKVA